MDASDGAETLRFPSAKVLQRCDAIRQVIRIKGRLVNARKQKPWVPLGPRTLTDGEAVKLKPIGELDLSSRLLQCPTWPTLLDIATEITNQENRFVSLRTTETIAFELTGRRSICLYKET